MKNIHKVFLSSSLIILGLHTAFAQTQAVAEPEATTPKKELSLGSAFVASLSSIIVSELGDKTFFIAAIMAMRYNRLAVYAGAVLALFFMTAISTAFGWIVPTLVPAYITHAIVTCLFFFFGAKLLYDAYKMGHEEGHDEANEVEIELDLVHQKLIDKKTDKVEVEQYGNSVEVPMHTGSGTVSYRRMDQENERKTSVPRRSLVAEISSMFVFWQALTLTFLGEWGDRSQISTIALAAEGNAFIVFTGAFLGHVCCTSLAVLGGKLLAKKISERAVSVAGGVLFLLFGLHSVFAESE